MSNLEENETSTMFKNIFTIKYKNRQEIISPPRNYDKLLDLICITFGINEEEKEYLKIYKENNLIDEDNYTNFSNSKDFNVKLNVINEKDEINKQNNFNNELLTKINEMFEKKFQKLEENIENKLNEKIENIKNEFNQKIISKFENIEKNIEKLINSPDKNNNILKQLKKLNDLFETSLNEKKNNLEKNTNNSQNIKDSKNINNLNEKKK